MLEEKERPIERETTLGDAKERPIEGKYAENERNITEGNK